MPERLTPRLVSPRRSAHASVRGYLYQSYLGVLRWLELEPGEAILYEGDEDLDLLLLGSRSGTSEQVKAHSGTLGLGDDAVFDTLACFAVTYVDVRRTGETRRLRFTTTAEARPRDDLLARWQSGDRSVLTIREVRDRLAHRAAGDRGSDLAVAITWLDGEPERWSVFVDAVEWRFGAPDIGGTRGKIQARLSGRADACHLPAETLTDRLLAEVLRLSSEADPAKRLRTLEHLADLLTRATHELVAWATTQEAAHLRIMLDEASELFWLITDGRLPLPENENPPPSRLLTAGYEVVSFEENGRREALASLAEWCSSDRKTAALLVTGEGGSGKSRLLVEWCRRLTEQGWHAGFLKPDRTETELRPLVDGELPRLVVVDYAETRRAVLVPLLREAALRKVGPKLRIALIARREGDWVRDLAREGVEIGDLLSAARRLRLTEFVPPKERAQAFNAALVAFAHALARKVPKTPPLPDLAAPGFERPLFLHMSALAALDGRPVTAPPDALKQTLERERLYWRREAVDLAGRERSPVGAVERCLAGAVTFLTLLGGAPDLEAARAVVHCSASRAGLQGHLEPELLDLVELLYGVPGGGLDGRILDPLQPDLLGETLVAAALGDDPTLLDDAFSLTRPGGEVRVLTVLTRLAQHDCSAERWLVAALRSRLEDLAPTAIEVAVETGDPVGRVLGKILETEGTVELAERVSQLCWEERCKFSVPLREPAFAADQKIYRTQRSAWPTPDEAQSAELARSADRLGECLAALGRHDEALEVLTEAGTIRRRLASRPGHGTRELAALATSLHNIGKALYNVGQYNSAFNAVREAVDLRQRLVGYKPRVFRPLLASSLKLLGEQLIDFGQRESALEATKESVEILRELDKERPTELDADLATSLDSLSEALSGLGQREQALEASRKAVAISRRLVERRPDAFLPIHASTLTGLGSRFWNLGSFAEAVEATAEAVAILRRLAKEREDAFLPNLAKSLTNLAVQLGGAGRPEEALDAIYEAVEIRRRLLEHGQAVFLPSLASSLSTLGARLSERGRFQEALEFTQEAVEIRRRLVRERPEAHLPALALGLNNLGVRYGELGQHEEALTALQEAVEIRRELSKNQPDAFRPGLAQSLLNLSKQRMTLSQLDEALTGAVEAVQLLLPYAERYPAAFGPRLEISRNHYMQIVAAAGWEPDPELFVKAATVPQSAAVSHDAHGAAPLGLSQPAS